MSFLLLARLDHMKMVSWCNVAVPMIVQQCDADAAAVRTSMSCMVRN